MNKNSNDKNFYIPMPCGGNGNCGKCKIKITSGNLLPNERDRKFLTEEEINFGFRIACGHQIPCDVEFVVQEENFNAVSNYLNKERSESRKASAIIIDVGTTTLCFQLIDEKGKEIKTVSCTNSQRAFGADVLSRVSKASGGGFAHLCNMLKSDLEKGICLLTDEKQISVDDIYIAGNTVMTYFLRCMDCRPLGVYPFENNAVDTFCQSSRDFFGNSFPFLCNVTVLPCIGAFVGGDIVAGAYFLNMDNEKNSIFIDIGTNGEIILNSGGKLFASSVAAGPAFEGGNISCGVGGVAGAINKIFFENGSFFYETIENKPPIGICGSALTDLIAELLENKIINSTGLLKDDFFSEGIEIAPNIFFKQNDIRQFQLAKSAVISGIECLMNYAGVMPFEIEKVFVGGGFGFFLNDENALKVGLFPKEFDKKIIPYGNTVLGGLAKIHLSKSKEFEKFVEITEHINLAEREEFQNLFLKNLNFE